MEKRLVELSAGRTLEVQCTEKFLSAIKKHFKLSEESLVTNAQIREFVLGSLTNALSKL